MGQGETGVDRDGPVRTHTDGASGLQEEYPGDCAGNRSHAQDDPQSLTGFVAKVPEEGRSGMYGDGPCGGDGRGLAEDGPAGIQETKAYSTSDLYTIG